jgi:hypothetical protein
MNLVSNYLSPILFDMSVYYKKRLYEFNEFSFNLWIRLSNKLSYYSILSFGNLVLYYDMKNYQIILKDTTKLLTNLETRNNYYIIISINSVFTGVWVPISFSYRLDRNGENSLIQLKVGMNPKNSNMGPLVLQAPEKISVFTMYLNIRNFKIWDNYKDLDMLHFANYM